MRRCTREERGAGHGRSIQGRITYFLSLSLSPTAYNVGYCILYFLRAAMTFDDIHPLCTIHVTTSTSRT